MKPCGGCGASVGALHSSGCDVERCPRCGGQSISCDCIYEYVSDAMPRHAQHWKGTREVVVGRDLWDELQRKIQPNEPNESNNLETKS